MKIPTKITVLICLLSMHFAMAYSHHTIPITNETPIIDLLREGESFSIKTTSLGCFHSCKDTYEISLKADVYTVQSGDIVKILSADMVDDLRDFETKLQNLSKGLCTTKDTYLLTYGTTVIEVTDDSCMFNGVHKLMRLLGFEVPQHK